jgi:serine/threonine protein kinase
MGPAGLPPRRPTIVLNRQQQLWGGGGGGGGGGFGASEDQGRPAPFPHFPAPRPGMHAAGAHGQPVSSAPAQLGGWCAPSAAAAAVYCQAPPPTSRSPLPPPSALGLPASGRYVFGSSPGDWSALPTLLGKGSYGSVYRAWDLLLHRPVALKRILAPAGAGSASALVLPYSAARECDTLAAVSLAHCGPTGTAGPYPPNVVRLYDVIGPSVMVTGGPGGGGGEGEGGGTSSSASASAVVVVWLAYELFSTDLDVVCREAKREVLQRARATVPLLLSPAAASSLPHPTPSSPPPPALLSAARIKVLLIQLLRGVAALHSSGILHRDLKPANLLLDGGSGRLVVTDLGIARRAPPPAVMLVAENGGAPRRVAVPSGGLTSEIITLWYRPPELLLGSTAYGGEVDIWSVGVILLELCAVGNPWPGISELDQLFRIFRDLGTPTSADLRCLTSLPHWGGQFPAWGREGSRSRLARRAPLLASDPAGLDLLARLLDLDPAQRITAQAALAHPYCTRLTAEESRMLAAAYAGVGGEGGGLGGSPGLATPSPVPPVAAAARTWAAVVRGEGWNWSAAGGAGPPQRAVTVVAGQAGADEEEDDEDEGWTEVAGRTAAAASANVAGRPTAGGKGWRGPMRLFQ